VVLMHGFPDNQHLYDYVAPALGDTHRTITFDFVGWGHSTHPAAGYPYTMESLRADLDAVAEYFHIDRMVPVVHDASGWPGIDWALDNESRVTALVLLNTTYHVIPGLAPPYVIRALAAPDLRPQFIDALGPGDDMNRALFRAQVGSFFTNDAARSEMLPVLEAALPRDGLIGLTAQVRDGSIARMKNVPRMQAFAKPVIVAFGSEDRMLNTTVAETFASIFPESTLEPVERAAHYVQLDRADRVIEIVHDAAARF
jgi:haloalkane dehalogenase